MVKVWRLISFDITGAVYEIIELPDTGTATSRRNAHKRLRNLRTKGFQFVILYIERNEF